MEKRQELSEKQEEFCRLLAEGKTTGEAERLIGFSKGYGWRLMRKEHIRRAIKVRKNPSAADAEETQKGVQQTEQPRKRETAKKAEILSFLTEVMRDEEEADLKTRMKAAELLGKRERHQAVSQIDDQLSQCHLPQRSSCYDNVQSRKLSR